MSLHRFFVHPEALELDADGKVRSIRVAGEEAEHAARVLRLNAGTEVVICDGTGMEYLGILNQVSAKACLAEVVSARICPAEPKASVCLFQGLAKGEKMDWIVQKCTELGVDTIYPVSTDYSVVRLKDEKAESRSKRWERVAQEAAKQCGRAIPPHVHTVIKLTDAVKVSGAKHVLVPWEAASLPLHEVLADIARLEDKKNEVDNLRQGHGSFVGTHNASGGPEIGVVIGPEGGLSGDEVNALQGLGAVPVTLGPRILRTETAAIATLTAVLFVLEEFGGTRSMQEWR